MTGLTVLLQDRQHIPVERDRFWRNSGGGTIGGQGRHSRQEGRGDKSKHKRSFHASLALLTITSRNDLARDRAQAMTGDAHHRPFTIRSAVVTDFQVTARRSRLAPPGRSVAWRPT